VRKPIGEALPMIGATPGRRAEGPSAAAGGTYSPTGKPEKKVKLERNRLNLDGVEHRDKAFSRRMEVSWTRSTRRPRPRRR
jgi:hypothetical protein